MEMEMEMEHQYELGIIGAGPAGYHAALEAAKYGVSAVLFESREPGGVCLFEGCIPTKSLVSTSKDYFRLSKSKVVKADTILYDWEAARQKKERDVKKLAAGLNMQLKQASIPIVKAAARLHKADDTGITIAADGQAYKVQDVILATGSHNVLPPIEGLQEAFDARAAFDSTAILDECAGIGQLLVIGAGVIGLEIASIYANTGSDVTILEREDSFLPGLDDAAKAEYVQSLKRKGIAIKTGQQVRSVRILQTQMGDLGITVMAADGKNGVEETYMADRVLVATGRKGCTDHIGLENVPAIQVKDGFIVTDEQHRTGCAHIYACGDVCGREQLAYTAGLAGEQVVRQISHHCRVRENDGKDCVPHVVFTNPEAAYIGMTETACIESGISYRSADCSMNYSSLFAVENERETGAFKLLCDEGLHILGCHIVGNGASDLIGTIQAYMEAGVTLSEIERQPVLHPSHMEIVKECIRKFGQL